MLLEPTIIIVLICYVFFLIGVGFFYKNQSSDNSISGYILGGRQLSPSVTALSSCASDMSSWVMLSLPGLAFVTYIGDYILIPISLVMGFLLSWIFIAKRIRVYTYFANNSLTIPDFLENRFHNYSGLLRAISSLVTVIFFVIYIASGIFAFANILESLFGVNRYLSTILGTSVIVAYTFLGGFLAVSWTDFFQGVFLLLALILIPSIIVISKDLSIENVVSVQPKLQHLDKSFFYTFIYQAGWGLAYFGQPHILSRFMAINSPDNINKARNISILWLILALSGSVVVGLSGSFLAFDSIGLIKKEHIFIYLSTLLSSPLISSLLITAILSAIMSSVDSQILIGSSTLTTDFYKKWIRSKAKDKELVFVNRIFILLISFISVCISLSDGSSIMSLVNSAWSGFGAAFGPVIILSLYWRKYSYAGCLASLITGSVTTVFCNIFLDFPEHASLVIPGFCLSLLSGVFVSLLIKGDTDSMRQFDEFKKILAN